MKKRIRIFSIILSFYIFFISICNCSIVVYAVPKFDWSDMSWKSASWEEIEDELLATFGYVVSSLSAIASGDFYQFMVDQYDFKNLWDDSGWLKEQISVNSNNETITFSADLVALIKQALKEYAEETNGFIIIPSIHFSTISPSSFGSSYQYQTAKALVNEYGLVGMFYFSGYLNVKDFSGYLNNTAGFYVRTNYPTYYYLWYEDLLKWSSIDSADNTVRMGSKFEKVIHTWDEAKSSVSASDGLYYYSAGEANGSYGDICIFKLGYSVFGNGSATKLVSKDGRNILVFKSKEALESYTVNHRTVYFGSKFYEDSGSVTGSWDDFQDWLDGKYDDIWDRLKELIPSGSTISEDELEKLIDRLLDQLDEIGDKVEEGNKETNNLLQKILDALNKLDATVASSLSGSSFDTSGIEGYLARILDDLDYIVYQMEESSEEEFQQKTNDMLDQVQYTFADLGEIAKKKFPLSIPWDIDALLGFLGGKNSPSSEAVVLDSFESDDFIIIDTSHNDEISLFTAESGDGDDKGHGGGGGSDHKGDDGYERLSVYVADVLSSSGAFMSADGDPVFALPFLVSKSLDIKGTIYIRMSKFKFVSQLGRTLFTCIFAMYLIRLTFNVVSLGKDVFE